MDLQSELLKSIWYAFTSLDAEHSGKVSKSQLKVLSHNLYTVLNIPHDPVALEEHFQDNDDGPVSNQGYMPYLNKYILAKATEGTFNKETFDDLCWMMTSKKNYRPSVTEGLCSQRDCFKLFCLFNLLSEDHYPLIIIPAEAEYLLKKIYAAMGQEWDGKQLDDLLSQEASLQEGMSVWVFLEHMNSGRLMSVISKEAFSLGLNDVFMEMYHSVLKKGYMLKKGHVRRSWQERWFELRPTGMTYYVSEDLKEKRGEIPLDGSCVVETLPDKEGRRCLFCLRTPGRVYEMSASDLKQRVKWIQVVQTAIRLTVEGKVSLHQELKLRRREQRQTSVSDRNSQHEDSIQHAQPGDPSQPSQCLQQGQQNVPSLPAQAEQQGEAESQQLDIDSIIQRHKEAEAQRKEKEQQEKEVQEKVQRELARQLEEVQKEKNNMAEEMAEMERKVELQKQKIQELEVTQQKLEEALNNEIQARLEEERMRQELEGLLQEEQKKLAELLLQQSQLTAPPEEEEIETPQPTEQVEPPLPVSPTTPPPSQTVVDHQSTPENLSHAALYVRQWNVQLNSLMKPITPADKVERLHAKPICPKQGQALTSTEFITKFQPAANQEPQKSEEEEHKRDQPELDERPTNTNGHQG